MNKKIMFAVYYFDWVILDFWKMVLRWVGTDWASSISFNRQ